MIKKYFFPIIASVLLLGCKSKVTNSALIHKGETERHTHVKADYFDSYVLRSPIYGTETVVTIKGGERKMVTNALPNHRTGAFPRKGNPNTISAQDKAYTFTLNPKYTGKPTWVREPGIALNGVKFEPGTAEVVVCETGENYRVEAFQDKIDLGLDFNHAHVQPTGEYHYHGTPTSVIEEFDAGKDLVHVGFAHDGFPIYYSKSSVYKPSYKLLEGTREGEDCVYTNPKQTIKMDVNDDHDGTFGSDFEYIVGSGDLDECNGITIDGKYMYLVTNEFPYVSRCLMGEVKQEERRGPSRNGNEDRNGGARKNFNELLEMMDTDKDGKLSKTEVKGPLKLQFSKVDTNKDGFLTKEELGNVGQRREQRLLKHN
ncbi:YHYH protein [Polaribacter sp. Z014]|uniref:YHYH protein n=1 Tax=Polaribacter sp. Z014 TaxID=2927126 RepID=UPI002021B2C4|nr:YHYH protein [Polaribacter sp. Z014]MCL7764664.1 YHYH protein [Polaribacter sp. Z014]